MLGGPGMLRINTQVILGAFTKISISKITCSPLPLVDSVSFFSVFPLLAKKVILYFNLANRSLKDILGEENDHFESKHTKSFNNDLENGKISQVLSDIAYHRAKSSGTYMETQANQLFCRSETSGDFKKRWYMVIPFKHH